MMKEEIMKDKPISLFKNLLLNITTQKLFRNVK